MFPVQRSLSSPHPVLALPVFHFIATVNSCFMLKQFYFGCALLLFTFRGIAQPCTLTQADLLAAPAGTYTIPAGQVLCINSNTCMGAVSNFPGACANTNISSITVNGTLRIMDNVSFNFAGSITGAGSIEILDGGRISLNGSINCSGMQIKVIDETITTGTSTEILNACNDPGCETEYAPGYRPFGVVATGLGYTATGCSLTGYPDNNILLPVNWKEFSGYTKGMSVQLNWSTASEQHNKGFEVQRINAGGGWEPAGWVSSKATDGNSFSKLDYSYTDNQPAGIITKQYRLKQVDINNNFSYSSIIRIESLRTDEWRVSTGGNSIRIQLQSASQENAVISVVSASGARLYFGTHSLNPGSNMILIPAGSYPKGLLVVTLQGSGGEMKREKVFLR